VLIGQRSDSLRRQVIESISARLDDGVAICTRFLELSLIDQ